MDIFGRTEDSYQHLRVLKDKKLFQDHAAGLKSRDMAMNFNALGCYRYDQSKRMMHDTGRNALGFGYLTNNLQALNNVIQEVLYLHREPSDFFPVNNNIPEGATTYGYKVSNGYGQANFIDDYGTNSRSFNVSIDTIATKLYLAGSSPSWTIEELRNAMFDGIPLDTLKIEGATQACIDHILSVGLVGDPSKGFTGLINNPDVPLVQEVTADNISVSTNIVKYINEYVSQVIVNTSEIFGQVIREGLTIYLPVKQFNELSISNMVDLTITPLQWLKTQNPFTARNGNEIKIVSVPELAGAGLLADNVTPADRMIIGFNDQLAMELGNSIQPRIVSFVDHGRYVEAPMEYKISQLSIKHPGAFLYVDGV